MEIFLYVFPMEANFPTLKLTRRLCKNRKQCFYEEIWLSIKNFTRLHTMKF